MASLTKRKRNGKICFELWVGTEPNRSSIWLGRRSKSAANEIYSHTVQLEAATNSNTVVPKASLAWLQGLSDKFYAKLVKAGLCEERCSQTVGAFFAERLDVLNCKDKTKDIYRRAHTRFFEHVDPKLNLRSITPKMVHDFYHVHLVQAGMSESYREKTGKIVREFFGKAVYLKLIEDNPFDGFKISETISRDRHVFISRSVILKILESTTNTRWRCLLAFGGLCGLRVRSEVAAICWEHIDWQAGTFTVPSVKTEERVVPLFGDFRPYLEAFHRLAVSRIRDRSFQVAKRNLR